MKSPHARTAQGNLNQPTRNQVLAWVSKAAESISVEVLVESFLGCGISNALDGTEDDLVSDDGPDVDTGDAGDMTTATVKTATTPAMMMMRRRRAVMDLAALTTTNEMTTLLSYPKNVALILRCFFLTFLECLIFRMFWNTMLDSPSHASDSF